MNLAFYFPQISHWPFHFRYIDLVDAATQKYNGTESFAAAKLCSRTPLTQLDTSPKCNDTSADGTSSESPTELSDYQVRGRMRLGFE